jgi:uncharacterized membrane protein YsdA (DUF1294 family)
MEIQINPILLILFALINGVAFVIMMWDKAQSMQKGGERISEAMMFFLATMFGSFGIYAGMMFIRHKTRKWYFILGIPALMVQNLATLYIVQLFLEGTLL